ncbi:MAG: glycosyltransferase, partial [Microbacterium sp.]
MHIAFFSDQHPGTLGGLQVSLGLQRAQLERLGHRVTVCAPDSSRVPSREFARADDVLLSSAQVGEHSFCIAGAQVDRAVDAGFSGLPPVDVVHVQADVWGAWSGYRFARRHGLPVVHTMHTNVEVGLPAIMPFPRAVFRLLFAAQERFMRVGAVDDIAAYVRVFADAADVLVAPSTHFAERLHGYGIAADIHVVPTGVDDTLLDPVRALPRTRRRRPVLLWPGRVS